MEEKEFNCSGTTYIENVVRECRCQPREKIVVRGRVVEQDGNDGMFMHASFHIFFFQNTF